MLSAATAADPFSGNFIAGLDGEKYRLEIAAFSRGQYDGEYRVANKRLPLEARRFGDRIAGRVGVGDSGFGFSAQLREGGLLWHDEKGRLMLFRRERASPGND